MNQLRAARSGRAGRECRVAGNPDERCAGKPNSCWRFSSRRKRPILLLSQRKHTKLFQNTVELVKPNCVWRDDFYPDRASVRGIVHDQEPVMGRFGPCAFFASLAGEVQVSGQRPALSVGNLQRSFSHCKFSYVVTITSASWSIVRTSTSVTPRCSIRTSRPPGSSWRVYLSLICLTTGFQACCNPQTRHHAGLCDRDEVLSDRCLRSGSSSPLRRGRR